jgi:hypothetical protein
MVDISPDRGKRRDTYPDRGKRSDTYPDSGRKWDTYPDRGSVRGSWGKGFHVEDGRARPPRKGRGAAVGSGQWGRRDGAA